MSPAGYAVLRHRLSSARPITFALIFAAAIGFKYTAAPDLPLARITALCLLDTAMLVPYRRWFATGRRLRLLLLAQVVVDIGFYAIIFAGGQVPPFAPFMLLLVIVPASLVSPRDGVVVTVLAIATHVVIASIAPRASGLPSASLVPPALVFIVVAYQSIRYGRQLERAAAEARSESALSEALLHAAEELAAAPTSDAVAERLASLARELTGAAWACVVMRDHGGSGYRVRALAAAGTPIDLEELRGLEIDSGPLERSTSDADVVECPSAERSVLPAWLHQRWRLGPAVAVPLARAAGLVGVLVVANDGDRPLDGWARRLLLGIARPAVLALDNARLVEDLRAASTLKSQFVGTVSHELRSPLHAIIGYLDMGSEELAANGEAPEIRDMLCRARSYSVQLLETVEATLDVGRIESGGMAVRTAAVSLDALVAEIAATVPREWTRAAVALSWEPHGPLPTVAVDAAKVKTIVRNLVHNALKFTDAGRVVVTVDAAVPDERAAAVRVTVRDTGIGIAAATLPTIFEMFRQGDGSFTRRHDGVGLGLYIVRRLVEALGGTIDVESEPGKGSWFTVEIPTVQAASEETRGEAPPPVQVAV